MRVLFSAPGLLDLLLLQALNRLRLHDLALDLLLRQILHEILLKQVVLLVYGLLELLLLLVISRLLGSLLNVELA